MACLFHSRFCVASLFLSCFSGNAAAHQHQWHAPAAPQGRPEAARPAERSAPARPAEKSALPSLQKDLHLPDLQMKGLHLQLPDLKLPQQKLTGLNLSFFPFLPKIYLKKNTRILNMKIL